MKKILFLLVLVVTSLLAQAQTRQLKVFRHDGVVDTLRMVSGSTISHSRLDLQGVQQDDYVTMIITIPSAVGDHFVSKYAIAELDSLVLPNGQTIIFRGSQVVQPVMAPAISNMTPDDVGDLAGQTVKSDMRRTSFSGTFPGSDIVTFYWTENDRIRLDVGDEARAEGLSDDKTQATFIFDGAELESGSYVVYYPNKVVTIATEQTQTGANNSEHIGDAGDCGTALAELQADGTYGFTLEHKASYLCFLPHIDHLPSVRISKIVLSSSSAIAGDYQMSRAGLYNVTNSSSTITLNLNPLREKDFIIGHNLNSVQDTCAAYMVIAPQTGNVNFTATYYLTDTLSRMTTTYQQSFSFQPLANTVYPINVKVPDDVFAVVDMGLSTKWAHANLSAKEPSQDGTTYTFTGKNDPALTSTQVTQWATPTNLQMQELIDGCTWESFVYNGVNGYLVTAKNPGYDGICHRLFLPNGTYWTSGVTSPDSTARYSVTASASPALSASAVTSQLAIRPVEVLYVDMGLPGHTMWATHNIGATTPSMRGDYYAWGETETKNIYSLNTYDPLHNGTGSYDNLDTNIAGTQYDVARVKWGGAWHLPTTTDFNELNNNTYCEWTWKTVNGQNGYLVKSKTTGNTIFLPAAGYRDAATRNQSGTYGFYYSSQPYSATHDYAYGLVFYSGLHEVTTSRYTNFYRYLGFTIRPVVTYTGTDLMVTSDSVQWKMGDTEAVLHGTFASMTPLTESVKVGFLVGDSLNLTLANADSVFTFTRSANGTFEAKMPVYNDYGYYWRAYVQDADTVVLGEVMEYGIRIVDLGLPSGTRWRNINLGASRVEERGDYYAWGETETKGTYSLNTYDPLHNGTGSYDNLDTNISGTQYDAVRQNLGGYWRMPTKDEFTELSNNCNWQWKTINGQTGYKLTSKINGNSIFLPAAGYRKDASLNDASSYGFYYSSDVYSTATYDYAYGLGFYDGLHEVTYSRRVNFYRYQGFNLRPVMTYTGSDLVITSDSVEWKVGDTEAILHGTLATLVPQTSDVKVGFLVGDSLNLTVANADSIITFTRSANGTFEATMPVYHDVGHYWRAYAQDADTTMLGDVLDYGVRMIDLGLPSGVLWRNMNVGASRIEERGDYFAWGEVETKDTYDYAHYDPLGDGVSQYDNIGTDISGTEYDAARHNLGGYWRMPTRAEFDELNTNCDWQWKTINGQTGYQLTSKINGNSIFLPAAGYRENASLNQTNSYGFYYSSEPYSSATNSYAYGLGLRSNGHSVSYSYNWNFYRYKGYTIRPVAIPGTELSTGARIDIMTDTLTYVPGTDHAQLYGTLTKYNHWSDNMTVGFIVGDSATFTAATAVDTVTTIVRSSGQYTLVAPYGGGDKWFRAAIFDGDNCYFGRAIHYGTMVTTDSASYRQGITAETVTLYGALKSDPTTLTQPVKVGFYIGKNKDVDRATAIDSVKTTVDANGKFSLTIAARDTIVYYRAFVELNDTCRGYGISRHYGFAFVDLGLPSGTWWANTNMGAASEITNGDQYAWGEVQPKTQFTQDNYAHYNATTGWADLGRDIAYSQYDAATHAFDGLTSMPSNAQYAELFKYCTQVKDTVDGTPATRFIGPNGNSIILWNAAWTATENALQFGYMGYPSSTGLSSKYSNFSIRPVRRINAFDGNGVQLGVTADSAQWSAESTVATLYGSVHAADAFSPVKVGFVVGADTAVTKVTADTIMSKQVSAAGQFSLTYNYKSRPAYYRAFVELPDTTYYGNARRVGIAYVDLGLASHTLWADMNLGSEEPSGLGYYITWGDTIGTRRQFGNPQNCDTYDGSIYKEIGRDIANTKYDAARAIGKGLWNMPTNTQWQELFNCTWSPDTVNSVLGYRVTGPNGKSIFLPAFCQYNTPSGYYGNYYWTSNTTQQAPGDPTSQYASMSLSGTSVNRSFGTMPRFYGMPLRAAATYTNIMRDSTYLYLTADSCDWTPESTEVHLYGTLRSQTPLTGATYGLLISRNNNPVVGGEGVTQLTSTNTNGVLTATTTLVGDRYYYRPYITIGDTTYYGKERRYGYAMIDLGLPSHTLWADVNLGATTDDGYGDYYQFGEAEPQLTTPFDDTTLSIHQPITDSLGVIAHYQYDAATVQLGGVWSTPTRSEIMELDRLCTSRPDTLNGTYGVRFTGPNGNSIFIPKAGMASGTSFPSYNGGNSLYIMSADVAMSQTNYVWQKAYYSSRYAPYWNESYRRLETDNTYNTTCGFPLRAVAHVSDTLATTNKHVGAVLQKWMPKKAADGRDLLEARIYGVPVGKIISQMGIILGRDSLLTRDNGTVFTSDTTDFVVAAPAGVDNTNYYVTLVGCSYRTVVPHISSQQWCRPFFVVDGETYYGLPHKVGPRLVDLGLPSGTLWADMNVGSIEPGGEGEYYQWGELTPDDEEPWRSYASNYYQYYNMYIGADIARTKYDVASQKWGPMYAIPTDPQWIELQQNTTMRPDTVDGNYGTRFIGPNGNSIFMPHQGYRYDTSKSNYGYYSSYGYYWTSNQDSYQNYPTSTYSSAYTRYFESYGTYTYQSYSTYSKYYGMPIRPVGKVSALLADGTPIYMEPIAAELTPSGYELTAALSLPYGATATTVGFYVGNDKNVNAETGTAIAAALANDTITSTAYAPFDGNRRWFRPYAVINGETVLGSAMEYGVQLVDLGLPSGTKWADMNLGATKDTDNGDYYQWGETTLDARNNQSYSMAVYDPLGDGANGYDDLGADISGTRFDAARANWGTMWSMPTQEQFYELKANCLFQTVQNSNNNTIGYRVVSKLNGNSIFLPLSGYYYNSSGTNPYSSTGSCYYWTSKAYNPNNANVCYIGGPTSVYPDNAYDRYYGMPIRPVARQNAALPDGTLVYVGGTGSHLHDGSYSFSGLVLNVPSSVTISSAGFVVGNDSLVTTETGTTLTATLVNDTLTSTQTVANTGSKRWYRPFIVVDGQTVYGTAIKFGVVLVDLGLPSGTLWADANLGADQPTEKGDYYLWGETTAPKLKPSTSAYNTGNYALYGPNGLMDVGMDIAYTQYDVAHVNMGGLFAMPTVTQMKELVANCTFVPENIDGVPGVWAVSNINGNQIFLPATGQWQSSSGAPYYYWDSGSPDVYLWTSSIQENTGGTNAYAHCFYTEYPSTPGSTPSVSPNSTYYRWYGLCIRPVALFNTTVLDGRQFYFESDSVAMHSEVPEARLYAKARGVTASMTDVTRGFVVGTSADVEIGPDAIGGALSAVAVSESQFRTTLDATYLDQLTVGTTYYARPFLTVGSETFYGEAMEITNSLTAYTDSTDWKQGATTVTFYGSADGATASSSPTYGFLVGDHADITAASEGVRNLIAAYINDSVFTAQVNDLSEGVHYYRAYAKVGDGYAYGIARRFGNGLVDLGLPSGTLWTTANLGSQNDFTVDSLYAWGETAVKTEYTSANYAGTGTSEYVTDISRTAYDVARAKLGNSYFMPNMELWQELINNCTIVRDTVENVVCWKVTSKVEGYTDRFIYLPMTNLWTATRYSDDRANYRSNDNVLLSAYSYLGYGVRPVYQKNITTLNGDDMFLHADRIDYDTDEKTATLNGSVRGITTEMTDIQIGFVVGTTEDVELSSAMTDGVFTNETATDGTFYNVLPATFVDKFAVGVTYYARPYITIGESETLYGNALAIRNTLTVTTDSCNWQYGAATTRLCGAVQGVTASSTPTYGFVVGKNATITAADEGVTIVNATLTDGVFKGSLTTPSGLNYYRAFAVENGQYVYGDARRFGLELVDLGLPSGTLWSNIDLGAQSETETGAQYAWGELAPKATYEYNTYDPKGDGVSQYDWLGNDIQFTRYDAANHALGGLFAMPTDTQWKELYINCTITSETVDGVSGYRFTSKTDATKSIFLTSGKYRWSSVMYQNSNSSAYTYYSGTSLNSSSTYNGWIIRPVYNGNVKLQDNTVLHVTTDSCQWQQSAAKVNLYGTIKGTIGSHTLTYGFVVGNKSDVTVATAVQNVTATFTGNRLSAQVDNASGKYYYRAYVKEGDNYFYGAAKSYGTELVDLGLPSGTLWASVNLGASVESEVGNKYAWGETHTKPDADFTQAKYDPLGNGGNVYDNIGMDIQHTQYDAAKAIFGSCYAMPSREQAEELYSYCTMTYTYVNGVSGYLYTSTKKGYQDKSIFIPNCNMWMSEVYYSPTNNNAYYFNSGSSYNTYTHNRYDGYYIRPVYSGNVTLADETILHVAADSCDWQFGAAKVNVYGTVMGKVEGQTLTYGFVVGDNANITVSTAGVQDLPATFTDGRLSAQADNVIGRNFYRAYVKEGDNYFYSTAKFYGVEIVDLGLPSGTLWTAVNLGAATESEYGYQYAWGETAAKSDSGSSYYDPIGDGTGGNDDIGMDIQHTKYDAATAAYGGVFAMPTREQIAELYTNCTMTSATVNGVSGYRYTNKSDATKSIFIPGNYIWMSEVYSSPTNGSAYYYYPGNSYNSSTNSRSSLCYIRAVYCGNVTLADQTVLNVTADSCDWQYGTANVNLYGTVRGSLEGHEATYGFVIGDSANINVNTEGVQNVNGTLSGTKLSALVANTSGKHYYRAYVKEGENYYYGTAKYYGFELVDFGLPSGTLWSSLNIGATIESEVGNKYAWGETVVKTSYTEATYDPLGDGTGSYDNLGMDIQHSGNDAATAAYGDVYAMPTRAQITELHTYCNVNSATVNGISGYRYTSKTDATKSIFIPGSAIWTSEVYNNSATGNNAYYYSPSTSNNANGTNRYYGYYIRPVYCGNVRLTDETVLNVSADSCDWQLDASKVHVYGTVRGDVLGKTLTCGFVFGDNANVTVETTGAQDVPVTFAGNRLFVEVDNSAGRTYYRAYVKEGSNYFYSSAKNYGLGLVDLGLPSGTLWLDANLGATTETEYGNQYAWGETAPKTSYSLNTYDPLGNGIGIYDNIGVNIQHTKYDAATAAYGDCYAMPTREQIAELYNSNNCTRTSVTINGVSGYRFTSKKAGYTDKSIFIPNTTIWSSEVYYNTPTYSYAYYYSPSTTSNSSGTYRYNSYYVRPVYSGNVTLSDKSMLYVTADTCDWHYGSSTVNVYGTVKGKVDGKSLTYGFVIGDNANITVETSGVRNVSAALVNGKLSAQVTNTSGMRFYRAYVKEGDDYFYSPAKSYGVELVDLGLPSGTLWAATNLGAATESEVGNKYAWGETFAKTTSNSTSYYDPLGNGTGSYDAIGTNIQYTQYDAATAAYGGAFAMPTREQIAELYNSNYCTKTSATVNGVSGYRFTSKIEGYTDKSIFIPNQYIWTSEVYNNTATNGNAYYYSPSSSNTSYTARYYGYYVRPVYNGGIKMSDGQRVNLVSSAAQFNYNDKTSTLSGAVVGYVAGMNVSEVGFVVSDAETVGVSTAADGTFAATLGADGTFTTTLPTSFMDRYPEGGTLYMRAYAVIEGTTYYAPSAVSWSLKSEITVASIDMPSSGTTVRDYSEYGKVTINHLYDNGGTGNYTNNCNGYLRLTAAPGCTWKITGTVQTESTTYDWLTIYNGSTTSSGYLGQQKIGGTTTQNINLQSTSNVILIYFRSDSSSVYQGIDLKLVAE